MVQGGAGTFAKEVKFPLAFVRLFARHGSHGPIKRHRFFFYKSTTWVTVSKTHTVIDNRWNQTIFDGKTRINAPRIRPSPHISDPESVLHQHLDPGDPVLGEGLRSPSVNVRKALQPIFVLRF